MKHLNLSKKSTVYFLFLSLFFLCFSLNLTAQNIAITDDDAYTAHSSAMLDVKSSTKGLLIPRLTEVQRTGILSPATGLLVFDTSESVFYYYNGAEWVNLSEGQIWTVNSSYVLLSDSTSRVGIGTYTPNSKLEVKADASFTATDTLFAVKDKDGNIVFAVFPDGAKVYVNTEVKGSVGGFAISGRSPSKATEEEYFRVTPDSTRIWINEPAAGKGSVGGFAISGRSPSKGIVTDYFVSTPDSTRIYVNDTVSTKGSVGGFAISGRSPSKGITNNYMSVTKDSTRIYVTESATKGSVGGFAISGRSPSKGVARDYFNVSGNTTADKVNNEPRMMWYPQKAALLAGEVHVGSADSVGTNSTALGYRSISKGDYSQAMGYKTLAEGDYSQAMGNSAQALGINSTAIGNYAIASAESSFAMGDSAIARGIGSYAFGTTGLDTISGEPTTVQTIANGDHSFAFGFGSYADTVGCVAIGTGAAAIGKFSMAFGLNDTAYADFSYALGVNSTSSGKYSFAIGASNQATKMGAYAIGSQCIASGYTSFAIGLQDTASAFSAFALGFNTDATELFATAMGVGTTASGYGSTAMGWGTEATNSYATSFGRATVAEGGSSTAFGYLSNASGKRATAFGYGSVASGEASTAFGNLTEASDYFATSFGASTVASGHTSTAFGSLTTASGQYSIAMGNKITVSGYNSVGIGLDDTQYTVSQNNTIAILGGNVGIGTTAPDYTLDVAGPVNIANGVVGTGAIVFRVDGDEALWYNGSVFSWGAGATSHNYFQENVSIGISTSTYPLSVAGTANLNSGISSGTALDVNGSEALWFNGSRFSWGYGGTQNYFYDLVSIGTTDALYKLNVKSSGQVVRIWKNTDGTLIRFATGAVTASNKGSISVSGETISYNAFTGSHYTKLVGNAEKGLLVLLNGTNSYLDNDINSEIIYGVEVAVEPNSQNIIGAYLGKLDPEEEDSYDLVMAVGNGSMWVIDNGENIEIGDYLISSSVAGHAMKDKGEFEVANIVGRVAEPVSWSNETALINGVKHKLISIFFENFSINHSLNNADELLNKIESLEKTNQELLKRLELIEEKLNKN